MTVRSPLNDEAGAVRFKTSVLAQGRRLALDGRFRMAFVIFAGMLALQSSPTFDATKVVYLVGTTLCLLGALYAVWRLRGSHAVRLQAPWLAVSAALAVVCALSFLVALGAGTSFVTWLRDVVAYTLFAAVPIFALDGQASASRRLIVGMLVVAGLLGGLAWALEWLNRREILELGFERLVFPSPQLPGMLYVFAMATALTAKRRASTWAALAGVVLGLFLITGTRSSLLLLVSPLAMVVLAGSARLRTSVRAVAVQAVAALAFVAAFQLALALPSSVGLGPADGSNVLGDRFGSLPFLVTNPGSDPSMAERVAQYEAAWDLFVSSPIVGVGPGYSIGWIDISGHLRAGFTADTPLVMPAKFGLLGILVFVGAAAAYCWTFLASARRDHRSAITLALLGYGVWAIIGLPLGFPIEDKGMSLALILLLALAFADPHGSRAVGRSNGAPEEARAVSPNTMVRSGP